MSERTGLAVKSGRVLLSDGGTYHGDVQLEDGKIRHVGQNLRADLEIDAAGGWILPGLIDLHTHGIHTTSAESGSLIEFTRFGGSHGTTTFYPTLFCSPAESARQMERHRRETDNLRLTPQVGGFRLEAPYLAIASGGSHKALVPVTVETKATARTFNGMGPL